MEKMRSRAAEIAGPDSTAMKTLDVYFDHLKAIYGRSDARTRGRMGERLAEIRDETKRAYGDPLLELEDGLIRMIQEFGR
jgi:hypothetical protein